MIVLLVFFIAAVGMVAEAWSLMLIAGMAHLHLLDAIHPISYGVSVQFILATLPLQILAVLLGALNDA